MILRQVAIAFVIPLLFTAGGSAFLRMTGLTDRSPRILAGIRAFVHSL